MSVNNWNKDFEFSGELGDVGDFIIQTLQEELIGSDEERVFDGQTWDLLRGLGNSKCEELLAWIAVTVEHAANEYRTQLK